MIDPEGAYETGRRAKRCQEWLGGSFCAILNRGVKTTRIDKNPTRIPTRILENLTRILVGFL